MNNKPTRRLVVVGQGAAGLSAALSAVEAGREVNTPLTVTLIEAASEADAGGNTRWSPANMRMAAPDRIEPGFVDDMLVATRQQGDRRYFEVLAREAPATVAWLAAYGAEFIQPPYYLAKGPPRIQPVGGGSAIVEKLAAAARRAGVAFRFECNAKQIVTEDGRVAGLVVEQGGARETLPADAIVLASGGFQGNAEMMGTHLGPAAASMRMIAPGTHFNTGAGQRMAVALGADMSGDWGGMHSEPVDPRSDKPAPVVLVYPYGVVVDQAGRRFFDEGGGLVHETWEWFSRHIQFETPGAIAYAILDSRLWDIAGYQRAIRSDVPPVQAASFAELARQISVDAENLAATVAAYNAACTGDESRFDATACDGLAAASKLQPPKSNWARALDKPPFLAYPLVGAVAYTFGGIATDAAARVLKAGAPIPGFFAAGEVTGHFYATAPNSVAVLRALVFGRIAGRAAVMGSDALSIPLAGSIIITK